MEKILQVVNLHICFQTPVGELLAVRGVHFDLYRGEVLAIVGESSSGKSVTAKCILQLLPKQKCSVKSGAILFAGKDLLQLPEKAMRQIRGKRIAMVFQDPMTALNPTMKVGKQIVEAIKTHRKLRKKEACDEALRLLKLVGIRDSKRCFHQFPHELSGGMRQRVVIAIALSGEPEILIADEPTTALDVTVQAQILALLKSLQKELNMSIILITHDLGVVARLADRVAVMYAGKIVEIGTVDEIFYDPRHPYTWGLLDSLPTVHTKERLTAIPGSPPNLMQLPKGDPFAPRNPYALKIDFIKEPPLMKVTKTHYAATWLLHKSAPLISRSKRH